MPGPQHSDPAPVPTRDTASPAPMAAPMPAVANIATSVAMSGVPIPVDPPEPRPAPKPAGPFEPGLGDLETVRAEAEPARATPLDALIRDRGGRMVEYAGHHLPVRFEPGVMEEHLHCRAQAALFDVSHMGQLLLHGTEAGAALEALVPSGVVNLAPGRQRYTMLLNEAGGVIDDLIVTRLSDDTLFLVVNGARREADIAHLSRALPASVRLEPWEDRALVALQGPRAADALAAILPGAERLPRMHAATFPFEGVDALVARCGYTGEDGFEISVPAAAAEALATRLLDAPEQAGFRVLPAGLGARDSLRLEAGLPLWGQDLDELTTPIEAGLAFVVPASRRGSGGFLGDTVVLSQLSRGVTRRRIGLRPEGRAPARAGTVIADASGRQLGTVTSGGFGPTIGSPISMGYVTRDHANPDEAVTLVVRGRPMPARVAALPFLAPRTANPTASQPAA